MFWLSIWALKSCQRWQAAQVSVRSSNRAYLAAGREAKEVRGEGGGHHGGREGGEQQHHVPGRVGRSSATATALTFNGHHQIEQARDRGRAGAGAEAGQEARANSQYSWIEVVANGYWGSWGSGSALLLLPLLLVCFSFRFCLCNVVGVLATQKFSYMLIT